MLFYDWKKIYDAAEGNALAVFVIFRMLVKKSIPKNKYDDIYKYAGRHFIGQSYLVHPDVLLYYAYKHSHREIAQYIALASMRPYADYLITGNTTLDLLQCEVELEHFEDNSLLRIENGKIHFIYEEVKQENIH